MNKQRAGMRVPTRFARALSDILSVDPTEEKLNNETGELKRNSPPGRNNQIAMILFYFSEDESRRAVKLLFG